MATLNDYLKQVQRFLRDGNQMLLNPADLIDNINRARRQVAMQSQSIRILTTISGQITNIAVTNGGTGYTDPTVFITAPDFPSGQGANPGGAQATAIATVVDGVITNIAVSYGGDGYFQPAVTIHDPTGVGATAVANVSPITVTQEAREVYPFSAIPLENFPGVGEILAVKSASFIYANYRYSLPCYSFSTYQSRIRQYPLQYQYVPTMMAQLGQGASGSLYFYPIPSTAYQFELDCICLPQDMITDQSVEAIPLPWSDAVPFLATSYAFAELQNPNLSRWYSDQYTQYLKTFSTAARPGRRTNPYGGW